MQHGAIPEKYKLAGNFCPLVIPDGGVRIHRQRREAIVEELLHLKVPNQGERNSNQANKKRNVTFWLS